MHAKIHYTGGSSGIWINFYINGTQAIMTARARRAVSAYRADPQELLFGRLVDELRELRVDRRERFKPPQFDGEGDIDLFIQHFQEVAEANGWNGMATLLHLREALQGGA